MNLNVMSYEARSLKCPEYQFEFVSMWTSLMSAGLHLTININSAPNFKIQKGQHRSRVDSKAVANPFHDSRTSVHFFTAIRHLLTCIAPRGARGGSLISRFNKNYRPDLAPQQLDMDSNFVSSQSGDIFTAMGDVFSIDQLPRQCLGKTPLTISNKKAKQSPNPNRRFFSFLRHCL